MPPCYPALAPRAAEPQAVIRDASLRFAPLRVSYNGAAAAPPVMLPLAPLASA